MTYKLVPFIVTDLKQSVKSNFSDKKQFIDRLKLLYKLNFQEHFTFKRNCIIGSTEYNYIVVNKNNCDYFVAETTVPAEKLVKFGIKEE
jgi:hypothetical protein